MADLTIDIGTLITNSTNIAGGRPHIAGTGVTVQRIVGWYQMGMNAEEIEEQYEGHISLAQVYAALSYYYANQREIDSMITSDELEAERIEKNTRNPLSHED